MHRFWNTGRWVGSSVALLALGGCVTSQQLFDFGRTELARTVADILGQAFRLYTQGTA